ncbi:hypothetical protein K8I31_17520, partial [bacterium]|nr:hypothetical protein [bacterium]
MKKPRTSSLSLVYFGVGLLIGVVAAMVLRTVYHASNTPEARLLFPDTAPQYLEETGNPLDLAINGPGFFAFEDDEGNWVFSRESSMVINEDGELASPYGYRMAVRGRPAGAAAAPKPSTPINPDNIHIDKINLAWEIFPASKTARAFQSIRLYHFPSEKNYVWGGDHFWFGRPPGETPLATPMKVSRIEPQIFQGYRLRPDPPPGEKNPFNVNGPYHNGPKDILNEKIIQTDRELDYGIAGDGFVAVDLSSPMNSSQQVISNSGIGFTRWLSLEENDDGVLERKYPGQLITVQPTAPPKAPRRSLSSIASIIPPVPPTVQRTQYIKNNVPILQSVQNAPAQPNSPDAFKL